MECILREIERLAEMKHQFRQYQKAPAKLAA